jgi:hypothetical protein
MLEWVTAAEMTELRAFLKLHPDSDERADLRNGLLCALVANLFRKAGAAPSGPADWCPDFSGTPEEERWPTAEELDAKLRRFAAAHGAEVPGVNA